jgi:hypothetical protein
MQKLVFGLGLILKRVDSRTVFILATLVLLFIVLLLQNGTASIEVLSFTALASSTRVTLFLSTLFDIKSSFNLSTGILSMLGSILGGLNIAFAYTYMKLRGEVIAKSGLYSGLGLFFAFLGIGCAACGTAFASLIFGFLGLSSVLDLLPFHGEELGYIGIVIIAIATYILAHKVSEPNVC